MCTTFCYIPENPSVLNYFILFLIFIVSSVDPRRSPPDIVVSFCSEKKLSNLLFQNINYYLTLL